jgi:hypothetical protein
MSLDNPTNNKQTQPFTNSSSITFIPNSAKIDTSSHSQTTTSIHNIRGTHSATYLTSGQITQKEAGRSTKAIHSDERAYQFAKISDMVDKYIEVSKTDVPEDKSNNLIPDEYFAQKPHWESDLEEGYSSYDSNDYGSGEEDGLYEDMIC